MIISIYGIPRSGKDTFINGVLARNNNSIHVKGSETLNELAIFKYGCKFKQLDEERQKQIRTPKKSFFLSIRVIQYKKVQLLWISPSFKDVAYAVPDHVKMELRHVVWPSTTCQSVSRDVPSASVVKGKPELSAGRSLQPRKNWGTFKTKSRCLRNGEMVNSLPVKGKVITWIWILQE